jgi:hypothetical protein
MSKAAGAEVGWKVACVNRGPDKPSERASEHIVNKHVN